MEGCAAILLCAGLSSRFGSDNKLLAPLEGRPLIDYAADLCTQLPFARRFAVVPPDEPSLNALLLERGFVLVANPDPSLGQDSSLRLGLAQAKQSGVAAAVVLLGDMPHVTAAHVEALCAMASDHQAAMTGSGDVRLPPTVIPAQLLDVILAEPDCKVRAALGSVAVVGAPASMTMDYDLPEDFSRRS